MKRKWPWIVGLAALLGCAIFCWSWFGPTADVDTTAESTVTNGMNPSLTPSVWSTLKSEDGDTVFSFISILLGGAAIAIAIVIFRRQKKDSDLLSEKIFGSLRDMPTVNNKIKGLLEDFSSDPKSTVHAMLYWSWFGADLKYPDVTIDKLSNQESDICLLIERRFLINMPTHVVVYDSKDASGKLKKFLTAALRYDKPSHAQSTVTDDLVTGLIKRYAESLKNLRDKIAEYEASKGSGSSKCSILEVAEIPNLFFTARGDARPPGGIIYLGETASLETTTARTGGFYTEDKDMVIIMESQVPKETTAKASPTAAGSAPGNNGGDDK